MSKDYDGHFRVVVENPDRIVYPVRPKDIRAGEPGCLLSTFGKHEIEVAAERLVLFFQSRNVGVVFCWENSSNFMTSVAGILVGLFLALLALGMTMPCLLVGGVSRRMFLSQSI